MRVRENVPTTNIRVMRKYTDLRIDAHWKKMVCGHPKLVIVVVIFYYCDMGEDCYNCYILKTASTRLLGVQQHVLQEKRTVELLKD